MTVQAHLEEVCHDAGLGAMVQVFEIVADRGEVTDAQLMAITISEVVWFYDLFIGPAIDQIEQNLLVKKVHWSATTNEDPYQRSADA